MGYGAPLKNQNKGYDAQEKKDLIGDMPITRVASGGTFLSKHMSPISMSMGKGMQPKMESPMEKELVGKQNSLPEGLKKAIEASPAGMHGALHMDKGAPTKMYGGKTGEESAKTKKEVKKVKANAKKDYK